MRQTSDINEGNGCDDKNDSVSRSDANEKLYIKWTRRGIESGKDTS